MRHHGAAGCDDRLCRRYTQQSGRLGFSWKRLQVCPAFVGADKSTTSRRSRIFTRPGPTADGNRNEAYDQRSRLQPTPDLGRLTRGTSRTDNRMSRSSVPTRYEGAYCAVACLFDGPTCPLKFWDGAPSPVLQDGLLWRPPWSRCRTGSSVLDARGP